MLSTDPVTTAAGRAVRRAAEDFVRGLAGAALLGQAARLEATLFPTGDGCLFGLDRALADAWPAQAGAPPARELILMRAGGELQGLKLAAFDALGRALLRRRYVADAAGEVRRLDDDRKASRHV